MIGYDRVTVPTGLYSDEAYLALLTLHTFSKRHFINSKFASTYLPEKAVTGEIEIVIQDEQRRANHLSALDLTIGKAASIMRSALLEELKEVHKSMAFNSRCGANVRWVDIQEDCGSKAIVIDIATPSKQRIFSSYTETLYYEVVPSYITARIPVKDMAFVVDFLSSSDKSRVMSRYGKEYTDKLVGSPRNPFIVESLLHREDQCQAVALEYKAKIRALDDDYRKKEELLKEEWERAIRALKAERLNAIKLLDSEFDGLSLSLEKSQLGK